MRGIVIMFIIGIVASVVTVVTLKKSAGEDSIGIAMGFGDVYKDQIEMNSAVGMGTKQKDPPRSDPISGTIFWEDWVEDHFQLFDGSRQRVDLKRIANSSIIPDRKVGGAGAEFFLSAKLTPGEEYVYEYIPIKAENKRFRHTFTAPAGKETTRPSFKLVE
jgi:hypothetical protein